MAAGGMPPVLDYSNDTEFMAAFGAVCATTPANSTHRALF